jgi:hypothetical protein
MADPKAAEKTEAQTTFGNASASQAARIKKSGEDRRKFIQLQNTRSKSLK